MSVLPAPSRKRGREHEDGQNGKGIPTDSRESRVKMTPAKSIRRVGMHAHTEGRQALNLRGCLPKLIVLDLDKTLWPFYCHEQTTGPYRRHGDEKDAVECWTLQGAPTVVRLFPEVLDILNCLKQEDSIRLAVASRSPVEVAAKGILGALGLLSLFYCLEIHRGSKVTHFKRIASVTGVPYREMVFFDDDKSNIKAVSQLGVCCVLAGKHTGLTYAVTRSGLNKYRELCSSRSTMRAWLQPATSDDTKDDVG